MQDTPFGKIPDNWGLVTINEACDVVTDYVANGSFKSLADNVEYLEHEDSTVLIRLVDYNNSFNGDFVYVNDHAYEFLAKSKLFGDEIIISNVGANVGTVFRCPHLDKQMTLGPNSVMLKFKQNDDFYFYWLKSPAGQHMLQSIVTGSAQPKFNKTSLRQVVVPVPSEEEQKKIADILLTIDKKIEANNKINRNLSEQLDLLYDDWFGKYKPFNLGVGGDPNYDLEEGWHVEDIYSVANIIYGAPFASKLFNIDGDGKPIVRIRDLKNQELCTFTTENHPRGYMIQAGDIVVGMDGEFRPYIWGNEEAWLNQRVCVFDNVRENGKAFIYCTIKPLLHIVEATEVATTVIHIGKRDYDEFRVVLPPENIMVEFEAISKPMYDQIVEGQLENRRLAQLRDSLLPKLMSGELDVTDLDI